MSALWLPLVPGVPLLMLLALGYPAWRNRVVAMVPWAALPGLLVAVWLPSGVVLPLPGAPWQAALGLDEVGRGLLLVSAVVWGLSGWFARGWLHGDGRAALFMAFWLAAMAGQLGLLLARDLPTFYLFFALMGFAAYGLVVHEGSWVARRAGRLYLAMLMVGEVCLFAGVALVASRAEDLLFPGLGGEWTASAMALLLFATGFGIKAGVLGLHGWLPVAHPAAPVPASAVLSGLLIKAGLVGWWRVLPPEPATVVPGGVAELVMFMGIAAALYGALAGLWQVRAKTVLAFSSVSQMGWLTLLAGVALRHPGEGTALAVLLLFVGQHALAKAALFLGVGLLGRVSAVRRGTVWWGLWLPALALAGAPLTGGFLAKESLSALLRAGGDYSTVAPWLLLASLLSTLLMGRLLWMTWPRRSSGADKPTSDAGHVAGLWLPWFGMVVLAAIGPWLWLTFGGFLPGVGYTAPVARQTGAVLEGLVVLLIGGAAVGILIRHPLGRLVEGGRHWRLVIRVGRRRWERRLRHWWRRGQTQSLRRERQLQDWPVVGRGLMLLAVVLWLGLLVEGGV